MAFDITKPAGNDSVGSSAALIRENFRALLQDKFTQGSTTPSSATGLDGYLFYNTTEKVLYKKINGTWTALATTDVPDATASVKGKAKLYATTGSATDGSMSQNAITTAINNINTIPVGTIIPIIGGASAYVPTGLVACDGTQYSKAQYPTLWSDYLTASTPKLVTCSYADYATSITTYGQCAKWAIDTVNETFKVPTIKDGSFMQQALTDAEIGKAYNAGLPNITGTFTNNDDRYATGAFGVTNDHVGTDSGGNDQYVYDFDASRSSSIYGNSTTVQPNAVTVRYFVCIAGGTTNQSLMDWSAFNSALTGKLNTDHTNDAKPYLKTTYVNGTSGYNIWSNGYCEQWGHVSRQQSDVEETVSFIKYFDNTNYVVFKSLNSRDAQNWTERFFACYGKTDRSFKTYNSPITTEGEGFDWRACGYLASGQY